MSAPIRISEGVMVPASAVTVRAVRSSGPGGQNVNKVASKIELRVDLAAIQGLQPDARERLERATAHRRDSEGRLLVISQRTRDQGRNLEDAREKVRQIVVQALVRPRERRPTSATVASRKRRLLAKKRKAARKRERRGVGADAD